MRLSHEFSKIQIEKEIEEIITSSASGENGTVIESLKVVKDKLVEIFTEMLPAVRGAGEHPSRGHCSLSILSRASFRRLRGVLVRFHQPILNPTMMKNFPIMHDIYIYVSPGSIVLYFEILSHK